MGDVTNMGLIEKLGDTVFYEVTQPEQTYERVKNAEIIITCKVIIDKPLLQQLPKLKLICVAATGTNNIDVDYSIQKGIQVKNVAGYSTNSVAQSTFSLILQLYNNISYFDTYVKSGEYSRNDMFTHMGRRITELNGKQFGIIGLGAIGQKVAEIATAFGCKVSYYSTSGKNNNSNYKKITLNSLLSQSDIVSIHSPLNNNTKDLLNANNIKLMKPSAIIINAGRGGIVNEKDLANAINENIIYGAGFDVYSKEPITEDNPLLKISHNERVVFSPHSAWTSFESRSILIEKISENIKNFQIENRPIKQNPELK